MFKIKREKTVFVLMFLGKICFYQCFTLNSMILIVLLEHFLKITSSLKEKAKLILFYYCKDCTAFKK